MNILIHEGVGFFAGTIIACSTLPRVIDIVRDAKMAKNESYTRNDFQLTHASAQHERRQAGPGITKATQGPDDDRTTIVKAVESWAGVEVK